MATDTAIEVVMPQMGVSVSEGTITKWLKQEGEEVAADEPLLEISTDKVDTEVPSPGTGTLQQILIQEGETVDVGTKLAVIGSGAATSAAEEAPPEPATQPAADASAAAADAETDMPTPQAPPAEPPTPAAPAPSADGGRDANGDGPSFVSPVVARIASEHGVDPGHVPGTGRGGRVTKKDILSFIESGAPAQAPAPEAPTEAPAPAQPAPAAPTPAPAAQPPPTPTPAPAPAPVEAGAGEQVEAMNAMRRGIAEHMRRSLDTAAHVTSAIEVDMSRVVAIREKLKPEFQKSYGVN